MNQIQLAEGPNKDGKTIEGWWLYKKGNQTGELRGVTKEQAIKNIKKGYDPENSIIAQIPFEVNWDELLDLPYTGADKVQEA